MSHDLPSDAVTTVVSTPTDGPDAEGLEEGGIDRDKSENCKQATTIDVFPNDVFLTIFDFCRIDHDPGYPPRPVWPWHRLAHVCQRWRQIVFSSPCRLDLQIYCTYGSPVRTNLGLWPAFPIVVDYRIKHSYNESGRLRPVIMPPFDSLKEVLTALDHSDRVCSISMSVMHPLLACIDEEVEGPFPVLKSLTLQSIEPRKRSGALPDTFLGGSTPRLQEVTLASIPFPTFPIFIRSARDLVELRLIEILQDGSISADTLAVNLAALTKLEYLHLSFKIAIKRRPDQGFAAPLTLSVLPALTRFIFEGPCKYLEEFMAHTAAPQLADLTITIVSPNRVVQVPQLYQFIARAESLNVTEFRHARIHYYEYDAHVSLGPSQAERHPRSLDLRINCLFPKSLDSLPTTIQLLSQLLSQSPLIISNVHHLFIEMYPDRPDSSFSNTNPTEWLALLRPFTAVETLQTHGWSMGPVVTALEDSTKDMVMDVLPALQLLNLGGQPSMSESLQKFFDVRRLSGRPVTVDNAQVDTVECDMCRYRPTIDKLAGLIRRKGKI